MYIHSDCLLSAGVWVFCRRGPNCTTCGSFLAKQNRKLGLQRHTVWANPIQILFALARQPSGLLQAVAPGAVDIEADWQHRCQMMGMAERKYQILLQSTPILGYYSESLQLI